MGVVGVLQLLLTCLVLGLTVYPGLHRHNLPTWVFGPLLKCVWRGVALPLTLASEGRGA